MKKKKIICSNINLNDDDSYESLNSFFKRAFTLATATCVGLSISVLSIKHYKKTTHRPITNLLLNFKDLSLEDVYNKIYSSSRILDDEMDYLYNEQFFNDIFPYVNSNQISKYNLNNKLNDLNIKVYEDDPLGNKLLGYYSPSDSNSLHINGNYASYIQYDVLPHEFIHLCQDHYRVLQEGGTYNLIIEACAEIMAHEYYDAIEDAYKTEIYLVKKLMEIIGSKPIMEYNFTGCFGRVEEELLKYVSVDELNEIKNLLTMEYNNSINYNRDEENKRKERLNTILDTVFERKYGYPSNEDPVVANLLNYNLERYYFNTSKINQEHSFIREKNSNHKDLSLKEALTVGAIDAISVKNDDGTETYYTSENIDCLENINSIKFSYYTAERISLYRNDNREITVHTEYGVNYIPTIYERMEKEKGTVLSLKK